MDSTFNRLGPRHSAKLVKSLTSMAKQVVLLVQEKELPRQEVRRLLEGDLAAEYELVFADGQTIARFALAYAINAGVGEGETKAVETRWSMGPFDSTGELRAIVTALYPDVDVPVRFMQHLVNEGLTLVQEVAGRPGAGPSKVEIAWNMTIYCGVVRRQAGEEVDSEGVRGRAGDPGQADARQIGDGGGETESGC